MIGMDRNTGKQLDGEAHIAQSITDILTTPIGTRVMREDYGSRLFELVDAPLTGGGRLLWLAATAGAIRRWEPRVLLKRVSVSADGAAGGVRLTLDGHRTDLPANSRLQITIPL